jgi:hypothetical protein
MQKVSNFSTQMQSMKRKAYTVEPPDFYDMPYLPLKSPPLSPQVKSLSLPVANSMSSSLNNVLMNDACPRTPNSTIGDGCDGSSDILTKLAQYSAAENEILHFSLLGSSMPFSSFSDRFATSAMDDILRDMIRKLCKFAEKVFSED